jgi:hypothetical protein
MTDEEFRKAFELHRVQQLETMKKVIALCRNLEPQLRDLNAHNTADRLAAVLGEWDANETTIQTLATENPFDLLRYMRTLPIK